MNLSRYKNLLTAIGSELSNIGDTNGARFFVRWFRIVDELRDAPHPNLRLRSQAAEVQRSARAIVILAIEHGLSPTALGHPKQTDLESAVDQLLSEASQIVKKLNAVDRLVADPGLPGIVNGFLSSVEFVMDYVQLHFCGSTLTALTLPEVREQDSIYRAKDPGYRDALCRRIGVIVRSVELHDGQELAVLFSDDSSLRLSLRPEDQTGPESATFSSPSGAFRVW